MERSGKFYRDTAKFLQPLPPLPFPSLQALNNDRFLTFPDALLSWWSFHYFGNVNTKETSSAHSSAHNLDSKQLVVYKRIREVKLQVNLGLSWRHVKKSCTGTGYDTHMIETSAQVNYSNF